MWRVRAKGGLCYLSGLKVGKMEFVYLPHRFVVFSHADVIDGGVSAHEEKRWMHVSHACSIHSGPGGWEFK